MSWGQWMVVNLTMEEELKIEAQSRTILNHANTEEISKLCATLMKQNAYQQKLIKQAASYINEIELQAMLADPEPTGNWWHQLLVKCRLF